MDNVFDILDGEWSWSIAEEDAFYEWFGQQLQSNPEELARQVTDKLTGFESRFDYGDFIKLYTLFQAMTEDEPLYQLMSTALVRIYFLHVDELIASDGHALYLLLDLFNDAFRETMLNTDELRQQFMKRTYPLLIKSKSNDGSDKHLAVVRYINFMADKRFRGGRELMLQFIADHPDSVYIDDINFVFEW